MKMFLADLSVSMNNASPYRHTVDPSVTLDGYFKIFKQSEAVACALYRDTTMFKVGLTLTDDIDDDTNWFGSVTPCGRFGSVASCGRFGSVTSWDRFGGMHPLYAHISNKQHVHTCLNFQNML